MTPGEALDQRIGAIERRLAALETNPGVVSWFDPSINDRTVVCRFRNREVTISDLIRWERIEKVATDLCFAPTWPEKRAEDMARLRAALGVE